MRLTRASFRRISDLPAASARVHHGFVYDVTRGLSVAFGGHPPGDRSGGLRDTWTWDGHTWSPIASDYPPRAFVSGAFQVTTGKLLSFGGYDSARGMHGRDTLEFDGARWTDRTAAVGPPRRSAYSLAYDSARQVVVLFGGYETDFKADIWEWDGESWTERCTRAPCSNGARPEARGNAVFVYDAARRVSVLHGGLDRDRGYSDTWLWDGTSFQSVAATVAPSLRESAAATYDPVTARVLLFGGVGTSQQEFNDLWAWDGESWTLLAESTPPSPRQGAALVWDEQRRCAVLLGGESADRRVEPWELTLSGNDCVRNSDCHFLVCRAGQCSEPNPPDANSAGAGGAESGEGGSGGSFGASPGAGAPSHPEGLGGALTAGATSAEAGAPAHHSSAGGSGLATSSTTPPQRTRAPDAPDTSFYACSMGSVGLLSLSDSRQATSWHRIGWSTVIACSVYALLAACLVLRRTKKGL